MLSGMWRIKDYISSLLEGGHQNEPSLDDLQDIEAEVDRITQDMETERIRHQDSLRDNVRLYDENQTLKATVNEQRAAIEKLRKERDEAGYNNRGLQCTCEIQHCYHKPPEEGGLWKERRTAVEDCREKHEASV